MQVRSHENKIIAVQGSVADSVHFQLLGAEAVLFFKFVRNRVRVDRISGSPFGGCTRINTSENISQIV